MQQPWGRAHTPYERVAQLVPDLQRNVALRVGQLYINEGHPEDAIQAFQRSIELAPDESDGDFSLARRYENHGRLEDARAMEAEMMRRRPGLAALAHQALGTPAEREDNTVRAEGKRLAQHKSDLVYALREAAVIAAHRPPIPGTAALCDRLRTARDELP